jgi:hypothetical protein
LSSADVRLSSASWRVSCAELGSSVAIRWPFFTCSPTVTLTVWSVPLVAKFTASSTPGSTLPLPDTVDCTTPSSAVTTSLEVLAELVGAPTSLTPSAMITIATTPNRYRYHGRADRRPRRRVIFKPLLGTGFKQRVLSQFLVADCTGGFLRNARKNVRVTYVNSV